MGGEVRRAFLWLLVGANLVSFAGLCGVVAYQAYTRLMWTL